MCIAYTVCSCFHSAYIITDFMGIRNENFMKVAAVGTWMGDFVTAWMVRNILLHFKRIEKQYVSWFQRKKERGREKTQFLEVFKYFNPDK